MAVYTEVGDEELRSFIDRYDIGEVVSFKGIAEGVENSNYLVVTETGTYVLTLYEKRVAEKDLPFFIALMEHLAAKGIACPTPIRPPGGEALSCLAGRPAALISFLDGIWIRRPGPRHCRAVGRALAELHLAGADFGRLRENALGPAAWAELATAAAPRADEVAAGLAEEIAAESKELVETWPEGLPSGVIHADLFPDNVFFIGETLSGLIDFYFACNDAYAYDAAICLNAWCFETDGSFNVTKARALLGAYDQVRPLTAEEFEALPVLARGAALRFLLTRLYDWLNPPPGALVRAKDPLEYLKKLRFHRGARSAAEYGLNVRG